MRVLIDRVLLGLLVILAVLLIIVVDWTIARACPYDSAIGDLLRRGSLIPILYTSLVLIGTVELSRAFRRMGHRPHTWFAFIMIALLMLSPWLSAAGWMGQRSAQLEGLYWQVVWLLVAGVGTGILAVFRGSAADTIRDVGATWILVLYLGFLNSFAVHLRCGVATPGTEGPWLLLILILVAKSADIGAYLVGTAIGRTKWYPMISPGKSVEGLVGGLLVSALVAVAFAMSPQWLAEIGNGPLPASDASVPVGSLAADLLAEMTRTFSRLTELGYTPKYLPAAILGVVVALVGQMGDLFESCFKREAGLKDSGHLIPRFGGILDVIDSLVLAIPVGWLLLRAVWGVI